MPTESFRSKEAYRRYRAYVHIHGIKTHAKDVVVAGKKHKVVHRRKKAQSGTGETKMARKKRTKIVMSASTKRMSHHPSSRHVMYKSKGGKSRAKRVTVKV